MHPPVPLVVETTGWVLTDAEPAMVSVRLSYDPADPLAVTVRLDDAGRGASRTWVFARELLADGLRSMVPVGEGRVQVQATSVLTEISYARPPQPAVVLRLPWWNAREFVRQSQAVVPRGEERCDVDAWVAALTGQREP